MCNCNSTEWWASPIEAIFFSSEVGRGLKPWFCLHVCMQHISRTEHWTVNKRDSCKVMNIPGSLLYMNTMWREYGNGRELWQYSFYGEFYMFLRTQAIADAVRSFVLHHLMHYQAALANRGWAKESTNLVPLHNSVFSGWNVFIFAIIRRALYEMWDFSTGSKVAHWDNRGGMN